MKGTGSGPRRTGLLALVWFLNLLIVPATFFTLYHWTAFVWIIGDTAWGIAMEIVAIVFILYVVVSGFCVLGRQQGAYETYVRLAQYDSYQGVLTVSLGIPTLVVFMFVTLSLLALIQTPATKYHLQKHSQAVFDRADTNKDRFINFEEFSVYQLSLESFLDNNTTEFREQLALTFDNMDSNNDGFLTRNNLYNGVVSGMSYSRYWFGGCTMLLACITASFSGIFWVWFRYHRDRDGADGTVRKDETDNLLGSI